MQPDNIPQYEISEWATAGMAIVNLGEVYARNHHKTDDPHRDNHCLMVLMTQGECLLNLDFKETPLTGPALFMIFPEQVHFIGDPKQLRGWAVSFDPGLMDGKTMAILEHNLRNRVYREMEPGSYDDFNCLLEIISKLELKGLEPASLKAKQSLLAALLNLLASRTVCARSIVEQPVSRPRIIEKQFTDLLKKNFKGWKQPSLYAGELAISVSHLNDTLKRITGKNVSTIIQEFVVMEAKRLLFYTSLSIKEIVYEVGYEDSGHFIKLFRKITGMTPLSFRNSYRKETA